MKIVFPAILFACCAALQNVALGGTPYTIFAAYVLGGFVFMFFVLLYAVETDMDEDSATILS